MAVFTAISFQSRTASVFAMAGPASKMAINMHGMRGPRVLALSCILFIVFLLSFLPSLRWATTNTFGHFCGTGKR